MYILFTSEFCPRCEYAKKLLDEADVEYEEVTDPIEASRLNITHVPCMLDEDLMRYSYKDIIEFCNMLTQQ